MSAETDGFLTGAVLMLGLAVIVSLLTDCAPAVFQQSTRAKCSNVCWSERATSDYSPQPRVCVCGNGHVYLMRVTATRVRR